MTLDLGTLEATFAVDTSDADRALSQLDRKLTELGKTRSELEKNPLKVDVDVSKDLDTSIKSTRDLKTALEDTKESGKLSVDAGQLQSGLGKATADVGRFKTEADRQSKVTPTVDEARFDQSLSSMMGKVTRWAAAAGAAFSAFDFARGVTQAGIEFQSQLNTMKAVSGATGAQLAEVTARARELGSATDLTATSASDAAGAMTELAKGGFSIQESMDAAKGTLQLASAAQVDAATAATIQSQALQAFGLSAGEAAHVADILAGAANASSAEMTGIAQGMQQAGTVSKQFGLSIDDTATALAMFANAGIQGSDAGTLMKSALLALTDHGKPAQSAIEELGLTVYDAQGNFVGLSSLMGQLRDAAARMTPEQYQAATATLFGSDAMRIAGIAAQQGSEGFDKLKDAVTRQGQAAEVAAAQTEGLPGAVERFQNTMEDIKLGVFMAVQDELVGAANAGVSLLDSLTPAIEGAASAAASGAADILRLGQAIVDMPKPMKDLAGTAIELGVALAVLKSGPVTRAFEKIGQSITKTKTTMSDFVATTRQSMADASAGYRSQAAELRVTAAEHDRLSKSAVSARTTTIEASLAMDARFGAMAASMKGKAAEIGAGMKAAGSAIGSGIGSIVDALGGPLNLALAGAGWAIMKFVEAHRDVKAAHENMAVSARDAAAAQNELLLAFSESADGMLSAEGIEAAATVVKGQLAELVELGEAYQGVIWKVESTAPTFSKEWQADQERAHQLRDAYKALETATKDVGIGMDDLSRVVAEGGPGYDDLQVKLRSLGPSGQQAAMELSASRVEMEQINNAARTLTPGMAEVAHAIDTIGDSASSSEEKLAAMQRMLDIMSGGTMGTQEAMMNLAETVSDVAEAVAQVNPEKGFGENLFTDAGLLNSQVENARLLHEELSKLQESFLIAGQSGADLGATYTEHVGPALDNLAQKFGLSAEDVERLREQFSLMPETVQTVVSLEGATESVQDMAELWGLMEAAKEAGTTTFEVDAMTAEAAANLEQLGFEVEHLQNGNWQVSVTGDVTQAREGLQQVLSFADEAAARKIEIQALLNTAPLEGSAAHADELLTSLDIKTPSPEARLIIDKLKNGVNISHGELAMLSAESAVPLADLQNQPLIQKALASKSEIASLNGRKAHTSAEMEDHVTDRAKGIKGAIEAIPRFWKTIFSSEHRGPAGGQSRYARGGLIPHLAAGDMTHHGYQLPMTGPGTDRTDGILGLDARGLATAWVDRGEYVTNRAATMKYLPLLEAINADNQALIVAMALASVKRLAAGGTSGPGTPVAGGGASSVQVGPIVAQTGDALTDLSVVQQQLDVVEEGAEAIVTADTAKADEALASVTTSLDGLPDTTTVGVTADVAPAQDSLRSLVDQLDGVAGGEYTPTVTVDVEPLLEAADIVTEALTTVGDTTVTPVAGLDTSELEIGADAARGNLADLDAQRPVPVASVDNAPLKAGVAEADAALHRVGAAKSTSVADVDNSSALTNIQGVITELNRMPVERVIKIVAHGSTGLAKGGVIPGLATGGTIAGTTLPTTGPGTAEVDGFLGVDGKGMPIVRVDAGEFVTNRESSRMYRRELEMINAGIFPKLDNLDRLMQGAQKAPGLFKGGVVSPDQLLAFARGATVRGVTPPGPLEGSPYVWGGGLLANWGDCSGAMSGLASLAAGIDVNGRKFATMSEGAVLAQMGFRPGLGPAATSFNIGWFNGGPWGGHTSGTIGGTNVEMGGGRGNGQVGGAAAGAAHPQYTDHAWIPLGELVAIDYYSPMGPVTARRVPPPRGGYAPGGGRGVGTGGRGVGPGGAGVTLHDRGGWHQPGTFAFNGLSEPEPILSPSTWRLVEQMIRVFPQATRVWVEAGQALDRAATQLTKISDTPSESAQGWRGILSGKFDYENILGASRGQPIVGLGLSGRDVLGGGLSGQIETLASRLGAGAQATSALNSELMVNLAMSDQTVRAYSELEKARADDEKASRDVDEAERKLTEARAKAAEKADDNGQAVVDAEEALAKARVEKVASAAALMNAQIGLQIAAVLGALELIGEVGSRISDAVVGGFEGAASGAALLAESIGRLTDNMATAAKIADRHSDAQLGALNAAIKLQRAVEEQRAAERKARKDALDGSRAIRAAEYDLRITRSAASQAAQDAEIDLSATRQATIVGVHGLATEAGQKAINSASNVSVAESQLALLRAKTQQQDYENTLAVATANSELELAQIMAGLEMDKLTAASYALAKAQAYAAGELGGATALERYVQGAQKMAEAEAKKAAGEATKVGAWVNPGRWFKGDTMKGAGMKSEGEAMAIEAKAMMDAYRDQMQDDIKRLNPKERAAAEKALKELDNAATKLKMGGAGVYSVITGDNGRAVQITAEMAMRKATEELDRLMYKSKYEMEAAQLEADRRITAAERKQRQIEIEARRQELTQMMDSWGKRDSLAELVMLSEQQLAENELSNKQLSGISGKIEDRKVSTLMSIGGAGWGGTLGAQPIARGGGFGGVRAGDLSLWETARMENGWLNRDVTRVVDTTADAIAAAGRAPSGLRDVVGVGGYSRGPVDGAAVALRDAARRSESELKANTNAVQALTQQLLQVPTAPTIRTQYTGPVTVNASRPESFARALAPVLARA